MLGPGMLIRPVVVQGASAVDVLLPREARWFDSMTGAEASRAQTARIPVSWVEKLVSRMLWVKPDLDPLIIT